MFNVNNALNVRDTMRIIEQKADEVLGLKSSYFDNNYTIKALKKINGKFRTKPSFNKPERFYKYQPLKELKFEAEKFWMKQLLDYYDGLIPELNERLQKQQVDLLHLRRMIRNKNNVPEIESKRERRQKETEICNSCRKSLLLCKDHKNPSHMFEYIDEEFIQTMPTGAVVCIDCECVSSLNPKRMLSVRIAALTDVGDTPTKVTSQTLIYHGWWKIEGNFSVFSPVVGITAEEIRRNIRLFVDRKKARANLFNKVIGNHLIVFANAKSDIFSMGLEGLQNYRDIQDYYVRYPNRVMNKEPVNLKWLTKNVLQRPLSNTEMPHDPVFDASNTLKLYRKIPIEFWEKPRLSSPMAIVAEPSVGETNRSLSVQNHHRYDTIMIDNQPYFLDEFTPDWSDDDLDD